MNYALKNHFSIWVQEGIDYCIPASIHSIFAYHKSDIIYQQTILLQLMILASKDHLPSFQAMNDIKAPSITNNFKCTKLDPPTFQDWLDNIIDEIKNDRPIAIATRMGKNAHIRVAYEIDDTNKIIKLYNPGKSNISKTRYGFNLSINSGREDYTFSKANIDWNLKKPCQDQLQIKPI